MKGDRVRTRRWSYLLQLMPTPFRWAGMEFIRFARWLDHSAARALDLFRASPAWFFVATVGLVSIGLTFVLFVSMVNPQARKFLAEQERTKAPTISGREHLEKLNDWTVQDKWRIAHLFVANQPTRQPKNIRIDSRLVSTANTEEKPSRFGPRSNMARRSPSARDIDVRLDLARPKIATQGFRTVDELTTDSETTSRLKRVSHQIRLRQPRALVQATWEFGTECLPSYYSGLPVRRSTPVPLPVTPAEPSIPLQPRRPGTPDISLDLELIRHTNVAGLFPPGSRVVSRSKRSEYPPGSLKFEIGLSSYNDSDWFKFNTSPQKRPPELIPYTGLGLFDRHHQDLNFADEDTISLPATAEVELRVELVTPDTVSAGHIQQSRLFISNEGQNSVPRIEIEDVIPRSEIVISASPDAQVIEESRHHSERDEKQLHREIRGLHPGESHSFDLRWVTKAERRYIQRTRVVTHAAVAAMTEVNRPTEPTPSTPQPIEPEPEPKPEPELEAATPVEEPRPRPSFVCDFRYLDTAYVGDQVDLEIAVRNTGDVDLHDVKVRVELPAQFVHQNGKEIVFNAGTIPVSGRNQTIMKVSAVGAGEAVHVLKIATTEKVHARGEAHILVVERTKPAPQTPVSTPVKPAPVAPTTTPTPSPVTSPCYCNQISMTDTNDFFSFP